MEKGFNFVHERQRVRLRVYRRVFFPKYVNIEGKTEKIFVDTGGQKEINYENPEDYNLDNPFKQVALYRLAQASKATFCTMKHSVMHCKVVIGTPEEVNGQNIPGIDWIPFNPEHFESLEERIHRFKTQREWKRRLK